MKTISFYNYIFHFSLEEEEAMRTVYDLAGAISGDVGVGVKTLMNIETGEAIDIDELARLRGIISGLLEATSPWVGKGE